MKRLGIVFFVYFLLLSSLISQAQTAEVAASVSNAQYETIKWDGVPRSKKYEVTIEKLKTDEKWTKLFSKQTKDTFMEVLLEPGTYRVSITTFNILGKKTISDWTEFYILDEDTPYIFRDYHKKDPLWNVPVLFINLKNIPLDKLEGSENYIKAEKNYPENSFFIKGKNIFSPGTSFSLIPSNTAIDGGHEYKPIFDQRQNVPLNIIARDTKKGGVYVSYDPDKLFTGYYSLEAKNGSKTSSYGIFVFAERKIDIVCEDFEQDARYKVNAFYIPPKGNINLSVIGIGISPLTTFTLIPNDSDGIKYPFATSAVRKQVPLIVGQTTSVSANGYVRVDLICNCEDIKPGYYYIKAENKVEASYKDSQVDEAKCLVLAKIKTDQSNGIEIKRISTKYNKRTQNLDFTIVSNNIAKHSELSELSVLSEYSPKTDSNSHVKLFNINHSGNKVTASANPENIIFGNNALIIKNADGISAAYFYIDKHFRSNMLSLSQEKADSLFLRPEGDISTIDFNSDIQEKVVFFDDEVNVIRRKPPLFPYLRFTYGSSIDSIINGDFDINFKFEFDVFNKEWIYFDLGAKYLIHNNSDTERLYELGTELFVRFAAPGYLFIPFIGLGVGYNLVDPNTGFNLVGLPASFEPLMSIDQNGFLGSSDFYFMGQLGCILFQFFDIRYNYEMHYFMNPNKDSKISHMVSMGVQIPLRRDSFVRQVLSQGAQISKSGSLYAYDYDNLAKVSSIEFEEGITEVNGFAEYNSLESITFSESIKSIGSQAFMNCSKLSSVDLRAATELTVISSQAFANDKKIKSLSIPSSVTKIEAAAFEGWTPGQTIYLNWPRNSTTKRDLEGLKDTKALVLYQDNTPYKPASEAYETVFNNPRNWLPPFDVVNNRFSQVFVYADNEYHAAVNVYGIITTDDADLTYKSSEKEVVNVIKFAKSIKFKVLGDGNKYMFYVVTRDGGCFAKEFKTKAGDITTVSVSINSLKRRPKSQTRKLNMNNVTFVQIVPSVKHGVECGAYFFDFEVEKK